MANIDTLELASQENGLIIPTPVEETLKKLAQMKVASIRDNVRNENQIKIGRITFDALVYMIKYLKHRHRLSENQIQNLSSEDLNRIPEIIFADQGKKVLLLGWIPLFGWIFASQYLIFKSRVKYLRSLDKTIFNKLNVEQTITWLSC